MKILFHKEQNEECGLKPIDITQAIINHPINFSISDLRQIAEHLLVYCNNNQDEE